MKKVMILSVIMLALCTTYSFAQRGQGGRRNMEPKEMAQWQTDRMKASLDLTDEQLVKVEALNLKYAKKMGAVRNEANGDRNAMRSAMMPLRTEKEKELKEILTSEQWDKFLVLRKDAQAKKGGKRRGI